MPRVGSPSAPRFGNRAKDDAQALLLPYPCQIHNSTLCEIPVGVLPIESIPASKKAFGNKAVRLNINGSQNYISIVQKR